MKTNKKSDMKLSSIYNGLWTIAYEDGHGTIELAIEEVFRSKNTALEKAKELNIKNFLNEKLWVIPLELSDERILIK